MSAHSIDADINEFIDREFAQLALYDAKRPAGHPYAFDTHSQRVAADMHALARSMNFPENEARLLERLTLVHDVGKRCFPIAIWDSEGKPSEDIKCQRREHTIKGAELVDAHFGADDKRPVLELMRDLMSNHHECVDGSGWRGLHGQDLSRPVRMLAICDSYDGMAQQRPHFEATRDLSVEGILTRMTIEKAGQFDPEILPVFADMKRKQPAAAASVNSRPQMPHAIF